MVSRCYQQHNGIVRVSKAVTVDEGGNRCGAADQMKRQVVLFAAIILGGCMPDQTKDVAACRTEADRFYQGYLAAGVDNPRSQYIIGCMTAKGYDFTIAHADCDSRHSLPTQAACYTPSSWLAWMSNQCRSR